MLKDSQAVYGRISQALHWLMAFYLVRQAVGVIAWYFDEGNNPVSRFLSGLHKPTGVAILVLVLIRIAWAATQREHRPRHPGLAGRLTVAGHGALYVLMLLVPVAGLLIDWGRGKRLEAYGMVVLEEGPNVEWAFALGKALHQPLGWLLIIVMSGHVAIALYHHFFLHDKALYRMIGTDRRNPGSKFGSK